MTKLINYKNKHNSFKKWLNTIKTLINMTNILKKLMISIYKR